MSRSISASISSASMQRLMYSVKKIDKSLEIAMMAELDRIRPIIKTKVDSFMQTRVYPQYEESDQGNMRNGMRFRMDKRSTGVSFSLHFDHPLLYAREMGVTVEGRTHWTPTKGQAIAVPYARALLSKKLAPLVKQREERIDKMMERRKDREYHKASGGDTVVGKMHRRDAVMNGTKAQKLKSMEVGERPPQFLVFRSLRVESSPFMGDVANIMFREAERNTGSFTEAAGNAVMELFGRKA